MPSTGWTCFIKSCKQSDSYAARLALWVPQSKKSVGICLGHFNTRWMFYEQQRDLRLKCSEMENVMKMYSASSVYFIDKDLENALTLSRTSHRIEFKSNLCYVNCSKFHSASMHHFHCFILAIFIVLGCGTRFYTAIPVFLFGVSLLNSKEFI
jgi:hypothetical protein